MGCIHPQPCSLAKTSTINVGAGLAALCRSRADCAAFSASTLLGLVLLRRGLYHCIPIESLLPMSLSI